MNQSGYDYSYKLPDSSFTPVKAGWRLARLQGIAHLGYQTGGRFRPAQKIAFVFQTDDEGKVIWQKHTVSKKQNSNLFKFFSEWQPGLSLDDLDLPDLLGKPASLAVKHEVSKISGKNVARFGVPMPPMNDEWQKIIVDDFALVLPGMPADLIARELAKLPQPLQKDYAAQLSEATYQQQIAEWKAREEAEKAAQAAHSDVNI